jgi:heme A synthase
MNCHGYPVIGIIQAIIGAIFVLYGVKVMIVNSFFYGTLDIGIGIAILSFAQSEYNQSKLLEELKKNKSS